MSACELRLSHLWEKAVSALLDESKICRGGPAEAPLGILKLLLVNRTKFDHLHRPLQRADFLDEIVEVLKRITLDHDPGVGATSHVYYW